MGIRIFIIDEHPAPRQMLAQRLGSLPDMAVVGSTGDAEAGVRQVKELRPDLVLVDIKMQHADGMEVCRRTCSAANGGKVAVLTSYGDAGERRLAQQAGIHGYLLKEVDTPKLAQWIRRLVGAPDDKANPSEA